MALAAQTDVNLASVARGAWPWKQRLNACAPPAPPVPHPTGLLYLCMKHVTDRYNMYYSYAPTKLNEQIHMAAVYQAIFAPLLGLFWMLFFSILRLGGYQANGPSRPCPPPAAAEGPQQHLCSRQAEKAGEEQGLLTAAAPIPGGSSRPQSGLGPQSLKTSAAEGRARTSAVQIVCTRVEDPPSRKHHFPSF